MSEASKDNSDKGDQESVNLADLRPNSTSKTRPDPTRPDQTRPDFVCDQTRPGS